MTTGIVIGCDQKLAWMLPWFMPRLERRCKLPVAFADFGLVDKPLCLYGLEVITRDKMPPQIGGWYLKPFAIAAAPFDRVVWMDIDIETKPHADFNAILAAIPPESFAACPDPYMPNDWLETKQATVMDGKGYGNGRYVMNTGFIVVEKRNPLLTRWCSESRRRMVAGIMRPLHSDQEIFAEIARSGDKGMHSIPTEHCALRLGEARAFRSTMLQHHTGGEGKKYIKAQGAR